MINRVVEVDILCCTPSYYHPTNSLSSVFFEDQVKILSHDKGNRIRVISVNLNSLRRVDSLRYIIPELVTSKTENTTVFLINFIALPFMKRLNFHIQQLLLKWLFIKFIGNDDLPQVIHAHQFDSGSLALWIKRKYIRPYVLTEHTSAFARKLSKRWEYKLAGKVYSKSSLNIAVSREFADFLSDLFRVPFIYIPNAVDTDLFIPGKKREDKFIFINIGSLDENKNQKLLIEVFTRLFKGSDKYGLIIVGDGPELEKLKRQVDAAEMNSQIQLTGRKERVEIIKLLGESSCFVLVSRYETFGIVLIEAMSCGLPIISTKNKGAESIIVSEALGMLCENSKAGVEIAIKRILAKEFDPESIRNYAIDNFSIGSINRKLSDSLKKVVSC